MAQAYTKRAQAHEVAEDLYSLSLDLLEYISGATRPAAPSVLMNATGLHLPTRTQGPNPSLSAHRRLHLRALLDSNSPDAIAPFERLKQMLAPIPPLGNAPAVSGGVVYRVDRFGSGRHMIGLTIDGLSLYSGENGEELGKVLYHFLRTHENMEMGTDLEPWLLVTRRGMLDKPVWADTEDNAILRFAALDLDLKADLIQGRIVRAVRANKKTSPAVIDALSRRTRSKPAPPKEWCIERHRNAPI